MAAQQEFPEMMESGNGFLTFCGDLMEPDTNASFFVRGTCLGYVKGIQHGVNLGLDMVNSPRRYCVPDGVTDGANHANRD